MAIDTTVDVLNQEIQGGATWEIGGTLNIDTAAGGMLTIGGTQQALKGTIVAATNGTNTTAVTIQFTDGSGTAVAYPVTFTLVLSDAATGAGLTATTASGAVGAGASGADLAVLTTKKSLLCQTDATGKYILGIIDTAKTQFYVYVDRPKCIVPVTQITTAKYG